MRKQECYVNTSWGSTDECDEMWFASVKEAKAYCKEQGLPMEAIRKIKASVCDRIMRSRALSDKELSLIGFLLDDVRSLVNAVNANDELAAVVVPDAPFGDMASFASYWDRHLKTLE